MINYLIVKEIQDFLSKNKIPTISKIHYIPEQVSYSNDEKIVIGPIYYVKTPYLSNRNVSKVSRFEYMLGKKYDTMILISPNDNGYNDEVIPNPKYEC